MTTKSERRWRYLEPGPLEVIVTETEIREEYYPWWQEQMRKAGKEDQISFENCIEDWVVVNWAEREYANEA